MKYIGDYIIVYSIIISTILALSVISQNCDYGYITEINGTCYYDCEYRGNYLRMDTLSFDSIMDLCSNVEYANLVDPSSCSTLNDLIWRNDTCACPFCKCTNPGISSGEEYSYSIGGPERSCYSCECQEASSDYGGLTGENIYTSCLFLFRIWYMSSIYSPETWDEYGTCPSNECTYTDYFRGDTTVYSGINDYWFQDGGTCDTLCYCPSSGDAVCEKGWDNIMANNETKDSFIKECGESFDDARACYNISSQSYDSSRLFTTDSGPDCGYSCPVCDCGKYNYNDTWYVGYQDYYDIQDGEARCIKCECINHGLNDNITYAYCDYGDDYDINSETCDPVSGITPDIIAGSGPYYCHDDDASGSSNGIVDALNRDACYGTVSKDYCQWSYYPDWSGSTKWGCGLQLGKEGPYNWGCASGHRGDYSWKCGSGAPCQAFSDGYCSYIDVNTSYTDCDGVTQSEEFKIYQYCCQGENCNHNNISDIDIDTECTRSTVWENLITDYWDCTYAPNSAYYTYVCDDDVTEITCDALEAVFTQQGECVCAAWMVMYNLVDSESKSAVQEDIDTVMEQYSEWNDVLGCDINIKCELSNTTSSSITTGEPTTGDPTTFDPTTSSPTSVDPTTTIYIHSFFVFLFLLFFLILFFFYFYIKIV